MERTELLTEGVAEASAEYKRQFPTEFNSIAISLQIENQDGANAASYRLNSSTNPLVNLPASNFRSFSNMNIVSVTVQTGAAGVCVITGQMTALPKPTLPEFGSL